MTERVTYDTDSASWVTVPYPVFAEDFYKRKAVSFTIRDETGIAPSPVYRLTITITGTDIDWQANRGFEISRSYDVRPLMLN